MFSQDCCTTFIPVSRNFCIINRPKFCMIVVRRSRDILVTYFGEKISIKFLNILKTFRTNSQHMKILMTLMQHSHECYAKGLRLNSQNSCENLHASEILA